MSARWMRRTDWGAPQTGPCSGSMPATNTGVAVHWIGNGVWRARGNSNPGALMRDIRSWHTPQGKCDFAYSLAVNDTTIIEGRSTRERPRVRVGSNGNATVNQSHYSVVCLIGEGDGPVPDAMLRTAGEAVAWLRRNAGAGRAVVGHRQLTATSCPGNNIQSQLGRISHFADNVSGVPGAPAPTPPGQPVGGWLIQGVIPMGAVTHVFFQNLTGGEVFVANRLAGTWSHVPNPQTLTDMQYQITRQGLRWTNAGRVGNPAAFGVRIGA